MRVLGIDPGLRSTGYGTVEQIGGRPRLIEAGVVAPNPGGTLETRLRELHEGIMGVVASTQPDWIVIEEIYTSYKNPYTAILMGHARGVLCLAGAQASVPVRTLGHSLVKRNFVDPERHQCKPTHLKRCVAQIRRPYRNGTQSSSAPAYPAFFSCIACATASA